MKYDAELKRILDTYAQNAADREELCETALAIVRQNCSAVCAVPPRLDIEDGFSVDDCIFALERIKFHLEHYDELQSLFTKEYREELATLEIKVIDRVISILKNLA